MQKEHFIGIDNVCAWPRAVRLADGGLRVFVFNQPTHGFCEGSIDCHEGKEEGRFWRRLATAAPADPGTARSHISAGLAANGDLLLISSGWGDRPAAGEFRGVDLSTPFIRPAVSRSSNGGRSWAYDGAVHGMEEMAAVDKMVPYGSIIDLGDGCLGVAFYRIFDSREGKPIDARLYVSSDDGRNWEERSVISADPRCTETDLVRLRSGRLLAVSRRFPDDAMVLSVSEDAGTSWKMRGKVSLPWQCPGDLIELGDGRVLLTMGLRNPGLYGVGARISEDCGETWGPLRVLVNFAPDSGRISHDPKEIAAPTTDGGYPSSTECEDGAITTLYYASSVPWHNRYHMGVVRWSPDQS